MKKNAKYLRTKELTDNMHDEIRSVISRFAKVVIEDKDQFFESEFRSGVLDVALIVLNLERELRKGNSI